MSEHSAARCGYVAIVGRPNVGKSTLLNHVLGQKISITSRKPQTTRHRVLGIKTVDASQAVYVDTPGVHLGAKRAINRYMNRAALSTLAEVDAVVFVVDGLKWTDEDQHMLELLEPVQAPVILAVNKVDRIPDKARLLPHLAELENKRLFAAIVPLSAMRGDNVEALEKCVMEQLPEGEPLFPPEQITDRSERFLAAELIREKLTRLLGQELPYALTVEIEEFKLRDDVVQINALIWVERPGQKSIVVGQRGKVLKQVGTQARQDMERLFGNKVFLRLWVKVKKGWSDDERALRSFGYED
jgi:GTP-binding protein Era